MYGEGAYTHADGTETLGGWKFGCPWNAVVYDSAGKLKSSYKDGVPQYFNCEASSCNSVVSGFCWGWG